MGENPQNLAWTLVPVAEMANAFHIVKKKNKDRPTDRFLCAAADDWIQLDVRSSKLSQWIMSNDLPGPALPKDVFYLINVGNGQFLDGAHCRLCIFSCHYYSLSDSPTQAIQSMAGSRFRTSNPGVMASESAQLPSSFNGRSLRSPPQPHPTVPGS